MTLRKKAVFIFFMVSFVGFVSCRPEEKKIRVGYFPNLTHAQALIARETGRFQRAIPDIPIEWTVFNAGPSVIEAMFAGHLDIAYIGPGPAVNGFVKSGGDEIRVIAGSASGGAALVVRNGSGIEKPDDFRGKKVASPQYANTQDIALRSWLKKEGYTTKDKGGDVEVLPIANADQLVLFENKEIDGSWTVEPWVSIFTSRKLATVFLEEFSLHPDGKYATTLVIARKKFLDQHPEWVHAFVGAHKQMTEWINSHPTEAKRLLNDHLEKITHARMSETVLDSAFSKIRYTTDPMVASVKTQAYHAYEIGFLTREPDVEKMFESSVGK